MAAIVREARLLARSALPIILTGPSGTGKTRMARAIHEESGRSGPFEVVDCAGAEGGVLRAELFGAVRGAFTGCDRDRTGSFARAHLGTLFLDEVGELSGADQARLLKAVEEREFQPVGGGRVQQVDVRVVSATLRDPRELRGDLAQRLGVELRVPALCERGEDIEPIARDRLRTVAIAPGALRWLEDHPWPGNVRELVRALDVAVLRSGGQRIEVDHLEALGEPEDELGSLISAALAASGGSERAAARSLGWARSTFRDRRRRRLRSGQAHPPGWTSLSAGFGR